MPTDVKMTQEKAMQTLEINLKNNEYLIFMDIGLAAKAIRNKPSADKALVGEAESFLLRNYENINLKKALTIFELDPNVIPTMAVIKKTYRSMAIKNHPDKNHGDNSKFQDLTAANVYLKALYDKFNYEITDADSFVKFFKTSSKGKEEFFGRRMKDQLDEHFIQEQDRDRFVLRLAFLVHTLPAQEFERVLTTLKEQGQLAKFMPTGSVDELHSFAQNLSNALTLVKGDMTEKAPNVWVLLKQLPANLQALLPTTQMLSSLNKELREGVRVELAKFRAQLAPDVRNSLTAEDTTKLEQVLNPDLKNANDLARMIHQLMESSTPIFINMPGLSESLQWAITDLAQTWGRTIKSYIELDPVHSASQAARDTLFGALHDAKNFRMLQSALTQYYQAFKEEKTHLFDGEKQQFKALMDILDPSTIRQRSTLTRVSVLSPGKLGSRQTEIQEAIGGLVTQSENRKAIANLQRQIQIQLHQSILVQEFTPAKKMDVAVFLVGLAATDQAKAERIVACLEKNDRIGLEQEEGIPSVLKAQQTHVTKEVRDQGKAASEFDDILSTHRTGSLTSASTGSLSPSESFEKIVDNEPSLGVVGERAVFTSSFQSLKKLHEVVMERATRLYFNASIEEPPSKYLVFDRDNKTITYHDGDVSTTATLQKFLACRNLIDRWIEKQAKLEGKDLSKVVSVELETKLLDELLDLGKIREHLGMDDRGPNVHP